MLFIYLFKKLSVYFTHIEEYLLFLIIWLIHSSAQVQTNISSAPTITALLQALRIESEWATVCVLGELRRALKQTCQPAIPSIATWSEG